MSEYVGKICPFCKSELLSTDEIVVCSECDMPHHKDCWVENQGCTTFGCMGTIKATGGAADPGAATYATPQPAAAVYCTRCGAQNQSSSSFCIKCGNRLTTVCAPPPPPVYTQANPANTNPYAYTGSYNSASAGSYNTGYNNSYAGASTAENATVTEELRLLIGPNENYYLPRFQEFKAQNRRASWNWMAFLFTPFWMIYRKMYGYGAAALGVSFLLSLFDSVFISMLSTGGYIVLSIFANRIYMQFLENKSEQIKQMTEPYRSQYIAKHGGVNIPAAILTAVGYVLLVMIIVL